MFPYRETNLKVRQAFPETAKMDDDLSKLSEFNGRSAYRNYY